MKVRDWVKILQADDMIETIGIQMDKGLSCPYSSYLNKNEIENSFYSDCMDEEVVQMFYQNLPHGTLLYYKNNEKRG